MIGIFSAWSNKVARMFIALVIVAMLALFGADISLRAGWIEPQLTDIHDCVRRNERVPLDGYSYSHCTFYNVTFVMNGTGQTKMDYIDLYGYAFASDDPRIERVISALNALGALASPVIDKNGRVIPPFGNNPRFGGPPFNPQPTPPNH